MMPKSAQQKRFRIALSYPGEHRDFVEQVAAHVAGQVGKETVLYDKYLEAEFARAGLDTYLQRLYHDESELIAVFLCADYERKEWCGLEWRAIRDLIKTRESSAVMLLRFDNTEIAGLFSTDGYIWIGKRSPQEVGDLILERLEINASRPTATSPSSEPDSDAAKGPAARARLTIKALLAKLNLESPSIKAEWRSIWRIGLGTGLAGILLVLASFGGHSDKYMGALSRWSYDVPFRFQLFLGRTQELKSYAVVVLIGDNTHADPKLDKNRDKLVDREYHIKLLERLERAGAKLVLFDLIFGSGDSREAVDKALGEQIHRMGNVILGACRSRARLDDGRVANEPTFPIQVLQNTDRPWGLLDLGVDADWGVRMLPLRLDRHPDYLSAAWRAAQFLKLPLTTEKNGEVADLWLRYYGRAGAVFGQFTFESALDTNQVKNESFAGKCVFIGDVSLGPAGAGRDKFLNPYGGDFAEGVEVHATAVMNLLRGDYLTRLPLWSQLTVVVVWGLVLAAVLVWEPVARFGGWFVIGLAIGIAGISIGFQLGSAGVWWPWLVPALCQPLFAWFARRWVKKRLIMAA